MRHHQTGWIHRAWHRSHGLVGLPVFKELSAGAAWDEAPLGIDKGSPG